MLSSDNPQWESVPWPESGVEVLGEVVWSSGVPMADQRGKYSGAAVCRCGISEGWETQTSRSTRSESCEG